MRENNYFQLEEWKLRSVHSPKINRLLILAAPSGAGKSYLIEMIQQGTCSGLCERLGIIDTASWLYLEAFRLKMRSTAPIDKLVLHYDLGANVENGKNFSNLDALIESTNHVEVLTLCVRPNVLKQRKKLEPIGRSQVPLISRKRLKRKIREIRWKLKLKGFSNKSSTFALYEAWRMYLDTCTISRHWLLDFNQNSIVQMPCSYDPATLTQLISDSDNRSDL